MTYLFALVAYGCGSIPFGFILCKIFKQIDIREHGSKNIGATNVFRICGKRLGLAVFFLDMMKAMIAVSLPSILQASPSSVPHQLLWGSLAILGHTFPIWLRFKGGKGVATSLGVFLAIAPFASLAAFLIFLAVFFRSRILSLGSLAASIAFPLCVFLLNRSIPDWIWLQTVSVVLTLFIFFTHRANIRRLLRGQEPKTI